MLHRLIDWLMADWSWTIKWLIDWWIVRLIDWLINFLVSSKIGNPVEELLKNRRCLFFPGATKSINNGDSKNLIACSYVFNMNNKRLGNPVAILPTMGATSLVRFCPLLFTHRTLPETSIFSPKKLNFSTSSESDIIPMEVDGENVIHDTPVNAPKKHPYLLGPLPYRMIFAIATAKQVFFYDTDMDQPFAMIDQIHATDLSDLAWSADGRMLVISSLDGYCSFVEFAAEELGQVYAPPSPPPATRLPRRRTRNRPSLSSSRRCSRIARSFRTFSVMVFLFRIENVQSLCWHFRWIAKNVRNFNENIHVVHGFVSYSCSIYMVSHKKMRRHVSVWFVDCVIPEKDVVVGDGPFPGFF